MSRRGYTPRDWRVVMDDPEPCTITAQVVAEFLEDSKRPRMAAFVRHLDGAAERANERERTAREAYASVLERLHQHEPPQTEQTDKPISYRPDWTCDG